MLDVRSARDRAVRLAVLNGHMPNFDLIHSRQRSEGYEACFGRCTAVCQLTQCRWHRECTMLLEGADAAQKGDALPAQVNLTYRA